MLVASKALVASSCDSNWMKAKFLLILTFTSLPYGSKCLSKSFVLVLIGSKFITNNVFEGLELADILLELTDLLPPRSCYKRKSICISLTGLKQTQLIPEHGCISTFVHSTRSRRPCFPNSLLSSPRIASSASRSSSM